MAKVIVTGDINLMMMSAKVSMQAKDYPRAEATLSKVIATSPDSLDAYRFLGETLIARYPALLAARYGCKPAELDGSLARNTPPSWPTSSPMIKTRESRRISSASASWMASE